MLMANRSCMSRGSGASVLVSLMLMLLCTVLACAALGGCSSGSKYEGHWVCCGVKSGTQSYDVKELDVDGNSLMTVDLNGDGSVAMSAMGESVDTTGLTWEETSTGVTLTTDVGSMDATYVDDTGQLTLDYLGQVVVLEKR